MRSASRAIRLSVVSITVVTAALVVSSFSSDTDTPKPQFHMASWGYTTIRALTDHADVVVTGMVGPVTDRIPGFIPKDGSGEPPSAPARIHSLAVRSTLVGSPQPQIEIVTHDTSEADFKPGSVLKEGDEVLVFLSRVPDYPTLPDQLRKRLPNVYVVVDEANGIFDLNRALAVTRGAVSSLDGPDTG